MWRQRPHHRNSGLHPAGRRVTINATVWGDQPPLSRADVQASGEADCGSGSELSQAFSDGSGSSHCCCCPGICRRRATAPGSAAAANSDVINGSPRRCPQRRRRVRSGSHCRQGSTRAKACQDSSKSRAMGQGSWSSSLSSSMRNLLARAGGAVSGASPTCQAQGHAATVSRTCFKASTPRFMPRRAP